MRGRNEQQAKMLLGVTPDDLVPATHPIRRIRELVDAILDGLSPRFEQMYSERGRPSIPPEQLLKATLLMAFYSIRSERQFCDRLQYDLLFKWFLGLNITDPAFDTTTFTHNRERLLKHEVVEAFLGAAVREARSRRLISEDRFTVDGTLLQAWGRSRASGRAASPECQGGENRPLSAPS